MKRPSYKLSGFTLIEILITMVIMSTLVLIAAQVLETFYKPMKKYWTQSQLISDRINIEKSWIKNMGSANSIEITNWNDKKYLLDFRDKLGKSVNKFIVSEYDTANDFIVSCLIIKTGEGKYFSVGKSKIILSSFVKADVTVFWRYNKNDLVSRIEIPEGIEVWDRR